MSDKFSVDAPKQKVLKALTALGFEIARKAERISMTRGNPDGSRTPLTMPNHRRIKGSTSRTICRQSNIQRQAFPRGFPAGIRPIGTVGIPQEAVMSILEAGRLSLTAV